MTVDLSSYTTPKLLLGLIGTNIMKSLSPAMHQAEGKQHALNIFYQLIDLANIKNNHLNNNLHNNLHNNLNNALNNNLDTKGSQDANNDYLPKLFTSAMQMGFAGLNITYPCKQAVLPYIDALSPDAAAIGAVNTVVFKNGKSYGYNTDCSGYRIALQATLGARPVGRVVLVGTGGAGAAVAHAIMALGASHLTLVDTDTAKAQALADKLAAHFGAGAVSTASHAQAALAQADGLVNATPLGMAGIGGMCVPADWILPKHWVSDVVYSPLQTEMLTVAASKGCTTIGGDGMNLWQAVEAFELFTGLKPDALRMGIYHKALFAHRGI
jgi:shikimate dehydrogenase